MYRSWYQKRNSRNKIQPFGVNGEKPPGGPQASDVNGEKPNGRFKHPFWPHAAPNPGGGGGGWVGVGEGVGVCFLPIASSRLSKHCVRLVW